MRSSAFRLACLTFVLTGCAQVRVEQDPSLAPGHWPQWNGPNRDNRSNETGLLQEWPPEGPKLLWKITGLGDGVSPVSVAGGRIYVYGYRGESEVLTALDGTGKILWSQPIGPVEKEYPGMRFVCQRSPTVDGKLLYATTTGGGLLCLWARDGRVLWQNSYLRFGGQRTGWGFSDRPIVDGKLLICAPGGGTGTLVALNKFNGAVVWTASELKEQSPNAAVITATFGGVRQYVVYTIAGAAGIDARNGRLLWRAVRTGATVVVPTPIVSGNLLLLTSGHGVGSNLFQIEGSKGHFEAKELYATKAFSNYRGGMILQGDHVYSAGYTGRLTCSELKTGTVVWADRGIGQAMMVYADGRLILRNERGTVALVEATPEAYREKGRFDPPDKTPSSGYTFPVLAGGRLYLRDLDSLLCYDLRGPDFRDPGPLPEPPALIEKPKPAPAPPPAAVPKPPRRPDAIFLATPQDVVEKMLDLARVTNEDVVYDLGSGDGRIVITAFRKHGSRAVGYEIDPQLVQESRAAIRDGKIDPWVKIEDKDLFTADLAPASVITLYLGAPNNGKLLPKLRELKPGTRIVSHAHLLGDAGPRPDREIKMTSREDGEEHTIYRWTLPLK